MCLEASKFEREAHVCVWNAAVGRLLDFTAGFYLFGRTEP